jgi:hypothetical protein
MLERRRNVRRIVLVATATLVLPALARAAAGASAVAPTDTIWTIAGGGRDGVGAPATLAEIDRPRGISQAPNGTLYVAQPWEDRVLKIAPDGTMSVFAGTGDAGYSGDGGPAIGARLRFPHSAVPLADGSVLIADSYNNRIRKVLPNGTIMTVAGDGNPGYRGDGGPATSSSIDSPRGVAALPGGGFLFPDSQNNCVRMVDPAGTITTVAGICGQPGYAGDGGPATSAFLNMPFFVSPIPGGGFLVSDTGNQRIRKVDASGVITTVAGNGSVGFSGDGGAATSASLNYPHAVLALPDGSFAIADTFSNRVRLVSPSGNISTLAGTGAASDSGDGKAANSAALDVPKGLWLTTDGYLLIADEQNSRIRAIGSFAPPRVSAMPRLQGGTAMFSRLTATAGSWKASAGKVTTPGPTFTYQWQRCDPRSKACTTVPKANLPYYDVYPVDVGWQIRAVVKASNPGGYGLGVSTRTRLVAGSNTATVTIARNADDGSVTRVGRAGGRSVTTVDMRSGLIVVDRSASTGSVGLLRFDTSGIPKGARVTGVRLQLQVLSVVSGAGAQLVIEPFPASRWPIGRADFAAASQRPPVAVEPLPWIKAGQEEQANLASNAVRPGTKWAAFRLLITDSNATEKNELTFASLEHRTLPAAALQVEYSAP